MLTGTAISNWSQLEGKHSQPTQPQPSLVEPSQAQAGGAAEGCESGRFDATGQVRTSRSWAPNRGAAGTPYEFHSFSHVSLARCGELTKTRHFGGGCMHVSQSVRPSVRPPVSQSVNL